MLADTGLNMVELKMARRWNVDTAVEEYIDDSEQVRRQQEENINKQSNRNDNSTNTDFKRAHTFSDETDNSNSDGAPDVKYQQVKEKCVKPSETGG